MFMDSIGVHYEKAFFDMVIIYTKWENYKGTHLNGELRVAIDSNPPPYIIIPHLD